MNEIREVIEVELIAGIEAYLADTGESVTAFCKRVANDPSLMSNLRNGRGVGPRLRKRIEAALTTTERKRA